MQRFRQSDSGSMVRGRSGRGFTLLELLIVVGIIGLLFSILIPTAKRVREQSRKTQCLANVRALTQAALSYAIDDNDKLMFPKTPDGEDSMVHLYPTYLSQLQMAVCPATENVVTAKEHLKNNAARGATDNVASSSGSHSYELRHWVWGGYVWPDGYTQPSDTVKTLRKVREPAKVSIITDALDDTDGGGPDINNWPFAGDNHGAAGANVGYMDGHAEWAPTGRPLLEAFINGYYWPNVSGTVTAKHGLQVSGKNLSWK